ncbi:Hypothetical protein AA314_00758 [Archangium gephyra]|uniref:Uncharacterized protein n=1 Tax=Archangium gephyra TaxID=48 RepID=A0AAC8TAR2_9BACT|nr:Hypothetical protein AA314_00758 [Archangium gephyra]
MSEGGRDEGGSQPGMSVTVWATCAPELGGGARVGWAHGWREGVGS